MLRASSPCVLPLYHPFNQMKLLEHMPEQNNGVPQENRSHLIPQIRDRTPSKSKENLRMSVEGCPRMTLVWGSGEQLLQMKGE